MAERPPDNGKGTGHETNSMNLYVVLLHYPMVNKLGKSVATSVTNFDIHDIARASRTYGVRRYFVVTPIALQRDFVHRIVDYWTEGEGLDFNPTRGDALQDIQIAPDLVAVGQKIAKDCGREPMWVMTSARQGAGTIKVSELREKLADGEPTCLVFGTGHGLHPEIMMLADATLEPIQGPTEFNHLSVRSAVSIYLDRLLARES